MGHLQDELNAVNNMAKEVIYILAGTNWKQLASSISISLFKIILNALCHDQSHLNIAKS